MRKGSCLCGAVVFTVEGDMKPPIACHCRECRQQSGHYFAASETRRDAVKFTNDEGLAWYKASDFASRGFCRHCGSKLFWSRDGSPMIHVLMASLEAPTALKLSVHMWAGEKGDYYDIADGLPQVEGDDI
ncbi:Glutathione-dependent formaldehyde-activating enzyme [Roseovarius litorisediminis]|uniref:Glutathione-dependent formaldehyde-activating enzyme n=1 Tax=Roseovarius litorisediminis TaxID=1312363 RepID=A0A1Y5RZN3_9RHOB|nr:GFA family protein [Roseovarius litorisediminis]SLN29387.1 Glutathione-dependent formaldehyde-activating enzyme [Roseovarius litorisediminis]